MNILVAGGAGFIGSHLCDKLLKNNCVIVADKLIFGARNIQHLCSDKELKANGKFKFYDMELAEQMNIDRLFSENKIDVVYHMAANSDIQKGGNEPSIDFNDTFLSTRALLEGMRKAGVKNMFFASTSAVYGDVRCSIK